MERMTKAEMIDFLKNMNRKERILADEKKRLRGSVETLEEAIERNNFSRSTDESGIVAQGFSPDKVFRVLLNSQRDIEEETRSMVLHLRNIYEKEDQISFVRRCLLELDTTEQLLIREAYMNDVVVERLVSKFCMSRSQLYRKLHKAVDNLVEIYNEFESRDGKIGQLSASIQEENEAKLVPGNTPTPTETATEIPTDTPTPTATATEERFPLLHTERSFLRCALFENASFF